MEGAAAEVKWKEDGGWGGASVRRRFAGHSTAPKGGSRYERGWGEMAGAGCR